MSKLYTMVNGKDWSRENWKREEDKKCWEGKISNREVEEGLTDTLMLVNTEDECWGVSQDDCWRKRVTGGNNKSKDPEVGKLQFLFRGREEASVAGAQWSGPKRNQKHKFCTEWTRWYLKRRFWCPEQKNK